MPDRFPPCGCTHRTGVFISLLVIVPLFPLPAHRARVQSAAMNDYDKAGRYLVKLDPSGFFRWFLGNPSLTFQTWIDARRLALPNQKDLTHDLIAVLRSGKALEAMCLELEAEARADALPRLLMYLARLWTEPAQQQSLAVSCVSGVILDLTGRSPARELILRSALVHECRLELTILRRHLANENAANLVAGVAAGEISPWLLGWVPLMQGGGESDIIAEWRAEAERRLTDERDRAVLGATAATFASLANCRPAWDHGLKGWNMKTAPLFDEVRKESREEGRMEEARTLVLRQGRQKFRKAATKKQQKALEAITDLGQLETLAERLLLVD